MVIGRPKPRDGSKMKFIVNHLVANHNAAAAETMVLAMTAGLDADRVVEGIGWARAPRVCSSGAHQ